MKKSKIKELLDNGNWMIRFSKDGVGYGDFQWQPLGQWTEAPDWNVRAIRKGGLFGQSLVGCGYCKNGSRMELCETSGKQVIIDQKKVKVERAKIIAINGNIPAVFLEALTSVGGSLDLEGYQHPLPEALTSVGGSLDLRSYQHPLPEGLTSGKM